VATTAPPGTVLDGFSDELVVAAGDGALSILELQGASGNRLTIAEFLRGCRIRPGDMLN
jgi:methionyl-tRNA formyltransferase